MISMKTSDSIVVNGHHEPSSNQVKFIIIMFEKSLFEPFKARKIKIITHIQSEDDIRFYKSKIF